MNGISRKTGKRISGVERLQESIQDILSTPLGSRVMRREYGSELYLLIDAPMTPDFALRVYAAAAKALDRWEPEFKAVRFSVVSVGDGSIGVDVIGLHTPTNETVSLEGVLIVK